MSSDIELMYRTDKKSFELSAYNIKILLLIILFLAGSFSLSGEPDLLLENHSGSESDDIIIEYYVMKGCHDCEEFLYNELLPVLKGTDLSEINFSLREFDILQADNFIYMKNRMESASYEFNGTPFILIENNLFYGNNLQAENIREYLLGSSDKSGTSEPAGSQFSFTAGPVFLAGLVDGINPCAITTLLFMISALSMGSRKKTRMLAGSIAFITAVFGTYTLIGFGILRSAAAMGWPSWIAMIIYSAATLFLLVFAALSIRDYILFKNGRSRESILKLPKTLTKIIHKLIRSNRGETSSTAFFIFIMLFLGCIISLLELVCTGQVYLPTLVFMNQQGESGAIWLLLLYNLAFIIPLVAVFAVLFLGISSERIQEFMKNHIAISKLGLAFVFLLLAASLWLI